MAKKTTTDMPILVVTNGRSATMEIGPRMADPGYPTKLSFVYWDVQRAGEGAGPDSALCAIRLTREWYEEYMEGKEIHKWLNTYEKLLAYINTQTHYKFGCEVCGAVIDDLEAYKAHLLGHKKQLENLLT